MYANDGIARYGWELYSAFLAFAGILWTFAAFAYQKRRPRIGHCLVLMGLLELLLSMLVAIPE